MTKEEEARHLKKLNLQQNAIKILINSIYGSFGNRWFYFYDTAIAQSITLQGQDMIKFSNKAINYYFKEKWHLDTEIHEKLGISQYKINKVDAVAAVYSDTDSCVFNTIINVKNIGYITISDLYDICESNGSAGSTLAGHESVKSHNIEVLNYVDNKLVYSPTTRIIKHKVSKEKWKITTASGKSVTVTGDHSLIVFRNKVKMEIKARDINIETDLVLVVKT